MEGLASALFWFWKNANSSMFTSDFNDRMVERGRIFFLYRKFLWGSPLVAFILCLPPPQTWQLNWTFIDELLKPAGFDFRFYASFIKLIRSFEPSNIYRQAENKCIHTYRRVTWQGKERWCTMIRTLILEVNAMWSPKYTYIFAQLCSAQAPTWSPVAAVYMPQTNTYS